VKAPQSSAIFRRVLSSNARAMVLDYNRSSADGNAGNTHDRMHWERTGL
jgi:hypothetical protein